MTTTPDLPMTGVESMPVAMPYVNTTALNEAHAAAGHAQDALEAGSSNNARLHLIRALDRARSARNSLNLAQGHWRGYNDRLDRLAAFLFAHEDLLEVDGPAVREAARILAPDAWAVVDKLAESGTATTSDRVAAVVLVAPSLREASAALALGREGA